MRHELIDDPRAFLTLVQRLEAASSFAFSVTSEAIGIATAEDRCALVPTSRRALRYGLHPRLVKARLRAFFTDPAKRKITCDLKTSLHLFRHEGVPVAPPFFDVALAGALAGEARARVSAGNPALDALASYHQAAHLEPLMARAGLSAALHEVEMPLVPVLSDMERAGIFVEPWVLDELVNLVPADVLSTALVDEQSGRIHPHFHHGTKPGERPHALAAHHELRRSVRAMKRGSVLIAADLAQLELRVLTHLAGEHSFACELACGIDAHVAAAARIFGVTPRHVTKAMSARTKRAVAALARGEDSRLGPRMAARVRAAFPAIDDYLRTSEEAVSFFGRRGKAAAASGAAEATKRAMIDAHAALRFGGFETHLVLQAGDELLFEGPERELDEARLVIRRAVEGAVAARTGLELVAELGYGASWLDARLPERDAWPESGREGARVRR